MAATSSPAMISVEEALGVVLRVADRLHPVTVPLQAALGLVIAEEIRAPDPLPPYRASIKDGYAVVASDGPGEYPVITESRAGNDGLGVIVTSGTVAYVTTGGPVPDGADAVVQIEDTEHVTRSSDDLKRVKILVGVPHGYDIRNVGCDIEKDTMVLKPGELIGSPEVGLLATMGVTMVKVYPRPTVGVLSTGDELVDPTIQTLNRGQIRDSNRAMLLAAAIQQQCRTVDLGIAPDNEESLNEILDTAIHSGIDILLTSGGVSMGDRDLVKPILEKWGTIHFQKVCMKPGMPLTFAQITLDSKEKNIAKKINVFGLPGNPVSCSVCFHLFAVPAIHHLSGWPNPQLQRVNARIVQPTRTDPNRREYHRATLRWELDDGSGLPGFVAESTGKQISSRLLSMKSANALLELPATGKTLDAGTSVQAIMISDISSFPLRKLGGDTTSTKFHQKHIIQNDPTCMQKVSSQGVHVKVAILTVSDTVASGAGPDRRKLLLVTFGCMDSSNSSSLDLSRGLPVWSDSSTESIDDEAAKAQDFHNFLLAEGEEAIAELFQLLSVEDDAASGGSEIISRAGGVALIADVVEAPLVEDQVDANDSCISDESDSFDLVETDDLPTSPGTTDGGSSFGIELSA